jgi:hypothetical protein
MFSKKCLTIDITFASRRHLGIHIRSLPLPRLGVRFLLLPFRYRLCHVLGVGKEKHSICFLVLFDPWILHCRPYIIDMERKQHRTAHPTCNRDSLRVHYDEFRRHSRHLAPWGPFTCSALFPWYKGSPLLLGAHGDFQRLQPPVLMDRKQQES